MYLFRCRKCGREIEVNPIPFAPIPCQCGHEMNRVYTAPNVIYKGSGFYSNDKKLTPVPPEDYDPLVD